VDSYRLSPTFLTVGFPRRPALIFVPQIAYYHGNHMTCHAPLAYGDGWAELPFCSCCCCACKLCVATGVD